MKSPSNALLALALIAIVATAGFAQEEGKKKKKKAAGQPQPIVQLMKKTEGLGLSDEQQTKVKAIAESYAPKFKAANDKMASNLTDAQKKARQEAVNKNKAEGKKGKEANEAINAALMLTEDQKKVQAETQKELRELNKQLNDEVLALLTPEQKGMFQPMKKVKKAST